MDADEHLQLERGNTCDATWRKRLTQEKDHRSEFEKLHIKNTFLHNNKIRWNSVNTDTKGTGQIVRINGVSVLSGVSEKKSQIHVFLTQRRRQRFLRQQNVVLIVL